MWLMTRHGFFSIVEKSQGEFHIRARVRGDLENLADRVPLAAGIGIVETPLADYAYRVVVCRDEVENVLRYLALDLDYPNFKDKISATVDQRDKRPLYVEVWGVLAWGLGAFGRLPWTGEDPE